MPRLNDEEVLRVFRESRSSSLTVTGVLKRLGLTKKYKGALADILEKLLQRGKVIKVRRNRFMLKEGAKLLTGRIQRFKEGFGFLLVKDGPDVFIPSRKMKDAISDDEVLVRLSAQSSKNRPEGEVIKILKREKDTFVGTFLKTNGVGIIIPDDPGMPREIPISKGKEKIKVRDRDKVVFSLIKKRGRPIAKIIEILGNGNDPSVDLKVVMRQFGLPPSFPEEVKEKAQGINLRLTKRVISEREDLRDNLIFTIDPTDAKDYDDAISIKKTSSGYSLGVHIADVSHYVKEGESIDLEARRRGTSVYLLDRVIPMLPEKLSNEICSLKPFEDRLTMSVWMTFDREGNLLKRKFRRSLISSKARLTYGDAMSILRDGAIPASDSASIFRREDLDAIRNALEVASELSRKLRYLRWLRGSLDFDLPEPEITLFSTGGVKEIKPLRRLESHQIIEDFMIKANETVAEFLAEKDVPTIFRVHEPPLPQKINEFLDLAKSLLGKVFSGNSSKDLQEIIELSRNKPESLFLNYLLLRSLSRATYSPKNVGHFGLASEAYLHFTSPIRRYPDLVVHRILKDVISRKPRRGKEWEEYLEMTADISSKMERKAESAEFALIDLKKLDYMKKRLGEEYEGIITHVGARGFFVEIPENLVEGFVSIESLGGIFTLHQRERSLKENGGAKRVFKLGQRVRVKVVRVDKALSKLDFIVRSRGKT